MTLEKIKKLIEQTAPPGAQEENPPAPKGSGVQDPNSLPPIENAPTEEDVAANDPSLAAGAATDPSMGGADMVDPSMGGMGMPGDQAATTSVDLGKAYELKKIYNRLTALESYLSTISDIELLKLREVVVEAMDLFKIVISNFAAYKENITDIIVIFYKFIDGCYETAKEYLKQKDFKDKDKDNLIGVKNV